MKKLVALTALLSSISMTNDYSPIRKEQNVCCNTFESQKLTLNYTAGDMIIGEKDVGEIVGYDTDCDGTTDFEYVFRKDHPENPRIYHINIEGNLLPVGYYYDLLEDGINGNEIKCYDLLDCVEKALEIPVLLANTPLEWRLRGWRVA